MGSLHGVAQKVDMYEYGKKANVRRRRALVEMSGGRGGSGVQVNDVKHMGSSVLFLLASCFWMKKMAAV
jgi:hypothetical protein